MINVFGITGGEYTPSSRFRFRQYIEPMKAHDINMIESYSKLGSFYSNDFRISKLSFVLLNLMERFSLLRKQAEFDIIFLQREIISTLYTYEYFLKKPLIFDVDDAIYLNQRGNYYAKRISNKADLIICGNNYLANYYSSLNKNIAIIPTPVDSDKYIDLGQKKNKFIVGWIGTSDNHWHLEILENSLIKLFNDYSDIYFYIVSDKNFAFKSLNNKRVVNIKWSKENEVENINTFDIGVMPLFDTDWTRGKCSFKLLQYMSCARPVVASNTGMNKEVLKKNHAGFLANNDDEWYEYISFFYNNRISLSEFGRCGRELIISKYSLSYCSSLLASEIKKIK
jgi:glycosyltransferase involved in cell wall biosynthesis